ncbi:helix-turn-helix domain-containing protein [Leptospira bandrabouensis]|uniref:AraC family transcriptional regulator n=1 Tax=Leptospira bandrabouensis TaxID=2484903 RepID=UPI00223E84DE|nr:helix-turn-helix domain-containing protein [Leptospira bandrabouensis]MCW7458514.1 helix-turn-helix domain-containing protein [Leptospira bandrabouensis]MCW7478739.1 helix-turn-helix domain-containing protein [Leptospira bandrabouensis]MCW7486597.1 helix-turn-helix domain-containing protein [Leptospira bandrabouensis]
MNLIPLAGALVAFLLAVSHWIETMQRRNNGKPFTVFPTLISQKQSTGVVTFVYHYAATFLFLTLGILQIHIYAELSGEIKLYRYFLGIHIPCLLLIGPLVYIYFEEMSGGDFYKVSPSHFLPSIVSLFIVYLIRSDDFQLFPTGLFTQNKNYNFEYLIHFLLGFAVLSILGYMVSIFTRVFRWKFSSKEKLETSFFPLICLLVYSLFVVISFVISQLFFMQIFVLACFELTSLLIIILLFRMNHKEIVPNFKSEVRIARYQESRLRGLDIGQTLQRLDDIMNLEQLYLNENLSLPILAKRLDLHTHQLSEILNVHLNSTFRNYVNHFRLQEAARLLLEKPDMTIISVIYASGFNSKSSFHKLFLDRFGQSPQNYRSLKK